MVRTHTRKRYSNGTQLYWKPLSGVVYEYLNHPESKFRNGEQSGMMKRRHLRMTKIEYIGKEANEIEEAETFRVSRDSQAKYTEIKPQAEKIIASYLL